MNISRSQKVVLASLFLGGLGCGRDTDSQIAAISHNFDAIPRQNLNYKSTEFIDIRGLGDSAWSGNKTHKAPEFGQALDAFDQSGTSYRGDMTFINWESVVAPRCRQFHGDAFGFVSHPDNIKQAISRGINLFGLSNNHTRDCHNGGGEGASSDLTVNAMGQVDQQVEAPFLWHGVAPASADKTEPKVLTFQLKGRAVKVTFNSLHLGRETCPKANCNADRVKVMSKLKAANADLRILALHQLEFGDQWKRIQEVGGEFVRRYRGDIVFGHGPHVWKPTYIFEQEGSGKKGVVFTSLGNFIHPGLSAQSRNLIGRALLDPQTLALAQVQVLSVSTSGGSATFGSTAASASGSNVGLKDFSASIGQKTLKGAYVNFR